MQGARGMGSAPDGIGAGEEGNSRGVASVNRSKITSDGVGGEPADDFGRCQARYAIFAVLVEFGAVFGDWA